MQYGEYHPQELYEQLQKGEKIVETANVIMVAAINTAIESAAVPAKKRGRPPLSEEEKARRLAEKLANKPVKAPRPTQDGQEPKRGPGRPRLSDEEKAKRLAERIAKKGQTSVS